MNAFVERSPRCSVLSSARASIFGGPLQGRLGKLDSLWQTLLFVGYRTHSGEYMVANSEGAFKTMKRILENERWNKSEIEGMPWTPWKFKTSSGIVIPGEADRAGLDSFLDIEIDKSISMSVPPRVEEDAMPRRVHFHRKHKQFFFWRGLISLCSYNVWRSWNYF